MAYRGYRRPVDNFDSQWPDWSPKDFITSRKIVVVQDEEPGDETETTEKNQSVDVTQFEELVQEYYRILDRAQPVHLPRYTHNLPSGMLRALAAHSKGRLPELTNYFSFRDFVYSKGGFGLR